MELSLIIISLREYRWALTLCQVGLLLAAPLGAGPPIYDTLRLSAAVLVRGESLAETAFSGEWTKKPAKQLPPSVAVYLKPSQVINANAPQVKEAARGALKLMGGAATAQ